MRLRSTLIFVGWAAWAVTLLAQTPAARLSFEVASVKANESGDSRTRVALQPGGRFTVTNVPLRDLIARAYGSGTLTMVSSALSSSQMVGGPDWMNSDRFDITATAGMDSTSEQVRVMLKALLAYRFKLNVHTEQRDAPIFSMLMAKANKEMGPRLRGTEADCAHASPSPGPPYPDGPPACNYIGPAPRAAGSAGQSTLAFRGVTMDTLASFLTPAVRRVVIDRTGLTGYFDGEIDIASELGPPPPPPGTTDAVDRQSLPSIFSVLQEQLGLRLESTTGPIDVLVIDHIEKPTEN